MAVTIDIGLCEKCDTKNSKSAQTCRSCRAPLPWSKAAKAQNAPAGLSQKSINMPQLSVEIARGFWVQCAGGLIFLSGVGWLALRFMGMAPYIPFLTYALIAIGGAVWSAGANMAD